MLRRLLHEVVGKRRVSAEPAAHSGTAAPAQQAQKVRGVEFRLTPPPGELIGRRLSKVTLIIPSVHRRAHHLRACLDHLKGCAVDASILVSDHSEEDRRGVIEELVSSCAPAQTRIIHHGASLHFLERLSDCAEQATTEYVAVHADDDFMLPDALEKCSDYLDHNSDFVACQGRTFFVTLERPRLAVPSLHRSLSRDEELPSERVTEQCRNFSPTLYALTRRDAFIEANRGALKFTDNVIFWQYLSSCLLVAQGKLRTIDDLYYLRLDNPRGWRATLIREADPTHWPYLIVAPEFSAELGRFKSGLASVLQTLTESERSSLVDQACLGLVKRAFAGASRYDAAELSLHQRLLEEGTREQQLLAYCGALAARGLDQAAAS